VYLHGVATEFDQVTSWRCFECRGNKYRMLNMGIAPIKTQRDYRRALKRIENFAGVAHEFGIALLTPNAILRRI